MADVLVARQPIFNRELEVAGYELLFRAGPVDEAVVVDNEGATATVMLGSLTDIGVERLIGERAAWINVSREFILAGYAKLLPPHLFVLEVLEGQEIDDQLVQALGELVQAGHRIALDDFVHTAELDPLVDLAAYVKLDLLALGREQMRAETERLRDRGIVIVGEKIETQEDFAFCSELGLGLFQGFFFCRPQLVSRDRIDASRLAILKLLTTLQDPQVQLHELEIAIAEDPRLSYRLLRYINSAFFGLSNEVRSIRQAVALLGIVNLRHWATLSLFTMVEDKPAELTRTALARARFCELTADETGRDLSSSELFTIGLLSVLDALFDAPLAELLEEMPLASDIVDALVDRSGTYGERLDSVIALESGNLDQAQQLVPGADRLYLDALLWADEASGALHDERE